MVTRLILVSGPVSAGKTTLARALQEKFAVALIKSRRLLMSESRVPDDRAALQRAGEALDKQTGGQWLAECVEREVEGLQDNVEVLVDAVRTEKQIEALRARFGSRVFHIHITARDECLRDRYETRRMSRGHERELLSYEEMRQDPTESAVDALHDTADVVIDTERCTSDDVLVRVASHLGYYGARTERLVDILVGGQWGSEGKGNIASYLAPEYDVLIRVGGPNAGHKVYLGDKETVTFRHLPSGTHHNEAADLVLAPGTTLFVPTLLQEIADRQVHASRLSIDPQAMVIEASDQDFEQPLKDAIASTAEGVGAATARRVLRNTFPKPAPPVRLARDIEELKPYIRPTRELLDDAFRARKRVFVEGTQGTGLSIFHGDYPHVTSRDTTAATCLAEAGIAPTRARRVIMVCRTVPIRVKNPDVAGNSSGPMGREITYEELSARSGVNLSELRATELSSVTKRQRRIAEFSWALLRRAAAINGPTDIALSFADYIDANNSQARRFDQLTPPTIQFIEEVERVAEAPVTLISVRFHSRCIIDRRRW